MKREVLNFLSSHGDLKTDAKFKDITTIKIGGNIAYLVSPYDINRLSLIIKFLRQEDIDYKIIGRGSNIICGNQDYILRQLVIQERQNTSRSLKMFLRLIRRLLQLSIRLNTIQIKM